MRSNILNKKVKINKGLVCALFVPGMIIEIFIMVGIVEVNNG